MEVIFDGATLQPVLSPGMKCALSVLSLIAKTFVEAGKCMKERHAAEEGQPSTLDEVMKQAGLNIPGLEEALARLMGGSDEARKAAGMVVNNPDPADLLRTLVSTFGVEPAPAKSPIVTPPPAAAAGPILFPNAPSAANQAAAQPGQFAAFRPDLTREARQAAASSGLPLFRPDLTPEAREAPTAAVSSSGFPLFRPDLTREARQAAAAPAAPPRTRAASPSLVAVVQRRLEGLHAEKQAHERAVDRRITPLERQVDALYAEWRQLCELAQKHNAAARPPVEAPTPTANGERAAEVTATPSDKLAAEVPATIGGLTTETLSAPSTTSDERKTEAAAAASTTSDERKAEAPAAPSIPSDELTAASEAANEPLPSGATAEEVVQAIELIDAYAEEARATDERQLERIAVLEQNVAMMRAIVQQAREAQEAAAAHA